MKVSLRLFLIITLKSCTISSFVKG
jgi:hypothetical protein